LFRKLNLTFTIITPRKKGGHLNKVPLHGRRGRRGISP
jgi:hypothetical protein